MSAPAPVPTTSTKRANAAFVLWRVRAAVLIAAALFVVVWQGFGLAGFGTDWHPKRVLAACVPLLACAAVLVWPKTPHLLRLLAVFVGLGAASWAW